MQIGCPVHCKTIAGSYCCFCCCVAVCSSFINQITGSCCVTVCAFPYILAFTTDSIEIRLVVNGNLVYTAVVPELQLTASRVSLIDRWKCPIMVMIVMKMCAQLCIFFHVHSVACLLGRTI